MCDPIGINTETIKWPKKKKSQQVGLLSDPDMEFCRGKPLSVLVLHWDEWASFSPTEVANTSYYLISASFQHWFSCHQTHEQTGHFTGPQRGFVYCNSNILRILSGANGMLISPINLHPSRFVMVVSQLLKYLQGNIFSVFSSRN